MSRKTLFYLFLILTFPAALTGCRPASFKLLKAGQTAAGKTPYEWREQTDPEEGSSKSSMEGMDGMDAPSFSEETEEEEVLHCVFICGAVRNPGVYYLPEGSRVWDAVESAGGFREDADQDYLNLAGLLSDGKKIRVYTVEESLRLSAASVEEGDLVLADNVSVRDEGSSEKVNLNTADENRLMSLQGIGASRARDIISYRDAHGPFRSIEEIMQISGIKEQIFRKICDQITI